jgi:hypothetical protein
MASIRVTVTTEVIGTGNRVEWSNTAVERVNASDNPAFFTRGLFVAVGHATTVIAAAMRAVYGDTTAPGIFPREETHATKIRG